MTQAHPRRSALYMPASNPRAIAKARTLDCDIVILDLEDAVSPESKCEARHNAVEAVRAGGFGHRELVVRVNGLDTPWGRDDLTALGAVVPDAILVPKVSSSSDVTTYDRLLSGTVQLWVMVETCRSLFQLDAIASLAGGTRMSTWVIGTNDLAKEMGCRLDLARLPLISALASSVAAARGYGLAILDGVYNEIEDDAGLVAQCRQGADFGFDGKTLIHPRQIGAANKAFSPNPQDIEWSRRVVAAFEDGDALNNGVLRIEGRMVERLHVEQARQLLEIADLIARAEAPARGQTELESRQPSQR